MTNHLHHCNVMYRAVRTAKKHEHELYHFNLRRIGGSTKGYNTIKKKGCLHFKPSILLVFRITHPVCFEFNVRAKNYQFNNHQ